MRHLPVPADGHACCTTLKRYTEEAEKHATVTFTAALKFVERSIAYAQAMEEFKATIENMRKCAEHASVTVSATAHDVRAGAAEFSEMLQHTCTSVRVASRRLLGALWVGHGGVGWGAVCPLTLLTPGRWWNAAHRHHFERVARPCCVPTQ